MVSVSGEVLPGESVAEELTEQVTGFPVGVGAQVKLTAPANPLTEERLMVSVPEPPEATGTMVVSGTMEKSERGLEIAPPLLSVVAEML